MNRVVVSYSRTGNNEKLAEALAREIGASHMTVTEAEPRTILTIVADILFNRTPKLSNPPELGEQWDQIVFVGPVWMGKIATPLRSCLRELQGSGRSYAYVCVSGGSEGGNPFLSGELKKRVGKAPELVVDLHVSDLLRPDATPEQLSGYRVSEDEANELAATAAHIIEKLAPEMAHL